MVPWVSFWALWGSLGVLGRSRGLLGEGQEAKTQKVLSECLGEGLWGLGVILVISGGP